MTLAFSGSYRNLFMGRGILAALSSPCAISVFQGVQPAAADLIANWINYNTAAGGLLVHYPGAVWTHPNANAATGIALQLSALAAALPVGTGVATWAIIWSTNVTAASLANASIPNSTFLLGPASNTVNKGIVRFTSDSITTGVSVAIADGSIAALS